MPKGRYSYTRIKRDKAGFRAYTTTLYPDQSKTDLFNMSIGIGF